MTVLQNCHPGPSSQLLAGGSLLLCIGESHLQGKGRIYNGHECTRQGLRSKRAPEFVKSFHLL